MTINFNNNVIQTEIAWLLEHGWAKGGCVL